MQVEHIHTIRVNALELVKRQGPVVTVCGHSVQLMNDHEAGYLMAGLEKLVKQLTERGA